MLSGFDRTTTLILRTLVFARQKTFSGIRNAFPASPNAFPANKNAFPANKNAFPANKNAFPARKNAFPARKNAFHEVKNAFPVSGKTLSARKNAFPALNKCLSAGKNSQKIPCFLPFFDSRKYFFPAQFPRVITCKPRCVPLFHGVRHGGKCTEARRYKKHMIIKSYIAERATLVKEAWHNSQLTGLAFGGFTYDEFCSGIAPSYEARADYAQTLNLAVGQRQAIDNADETTAEILQHVVDGIKSHPGQGLNSPFYRQCGYIPKNQRRSGNTRGSSGTEELTLPPSGSLN